MGKKHLEKTTLLFLFQDRTSVEC